MVRISLLLSFMLVGCVSDPHKFDCKMGVGVGCKSITEVDHMVNKGLGKEQKVLAENIPMTPVNIITTEKGGGIARIREEYLRIWLAPFQDSQGNLHSSSIIHTVLTPGYWQLQEGE